jgi:hypothetical protein
VTKQFSVLLWSILAVATMNTGVPIVLVRTEDMVNSLSEKNEKIPPELIIKLINLVGDEYDG